MTDQPASPPSRPTTDDPAAWRAYWKSQNMPWRTEPEITPERQAYLVERRAIKPDIEKGIYPFKDIEPKLTRADIEWLLATHDDGRGFVGPVDWSDERQRERVGLDLRGADLRDAYLYRLPLSRVHGCLDYLLLPPPSPEQRAAAATHLERVDLSQARLEGVQMRDAHFEKANLTAARLDYADLSVAHLEGAELTEAHLRRANLGGTIWAGMQSGRGQEGSVAHLEGVVLRRANLEAANLTRAHMEEADLSSTHLEEANLSNAHLGGADLRRASFSELTNLESVRLSDRRHGNVKLGDVRWGGVDLTVVDWHQLKRLGDETEDEYPNISSYGSSTSERRIQRFDLRGWANALRPSKIQFWALISVMIIWVYLKVVIWRRLGPHLEAVRAYRRLADELRRQGLTEEADRFAYRAQICKRRILLRRFRVLAWAFSWVLCAVAGYGYKPGRSIFVYLIAVFGFAAVYYTLGPSLGVPLSPLGAFVFSLTSFHGRGFFPGGSPGHSITLDDPLIVLAAIEAVFGLVIEVSFIATFTQRFFAK